MASKPESIKEMTLAACLSNGVDLSDDWIYVIVYFPHSYDGMEYEILCEQKPEYLLLQKNDPITIYVTPKVKTAGRVVAVMTDIEAAQNQFNLVVEKRKSFNEALRRVYKEQGNKLKEEPKDLELRDAGAARQSTAGTSGKQKHEELNDRASNSGVPSPSATKPNDVIGGAKTEKSSNKEKLKKHKKQICPSTVLSPSGASGNKVLSRKTKTKSLKQSHTEKYKRLQKKHEESKKLIAALMKMIKSYTNSHNARHCTCQANQSLPLENCNGCVRRLSSQGNSFGDTPTSSQNATMKCNLPQRRHSEGNVQNEENTRSSVHQEENFARPSTSSSNESRGKRSQRTPSDDKENVEKSSNKRRKSSQGSTNSPKQGSKRKALEEQHSVDNNEDMGSSGAEVSSADGKQNVEIIDGMVRIGPGQTPIPVEIYDSINWSNHSIATRKLLMAVFPREVLASHSLSGRECPAGIGQKEVKTKLDQTIINDIVATVVKNCGVQTSVARHAVTSKCADENKLYRMRMKPKPAKKKDDDNSIVLEEGVSDKLQ